jgi:hypothetical protein
MGEMLESGGVNSEDIEYFWAEFQSHDYRQGDKSLEILKDI